MEPTPQPASTHPLRDYLAVLQRHWLVVLFMLIAVPVTALVLSSRETPKYQASSDIFIKREDLSRSLTGISDPLANQDPTRTLKNEAALAVTPEVAKRTVNDVGKPFDLTQFYDGVEADTANDTDILTLAFTDPDPTLARTVATAWAREFAKYSSEIDTESIQQAQDNVENALRQVRLTDPADRARINDLSGQAEQLRTLLALQTANSLVIREPSGAKQVAPDNVRAALLGVLLGIALGIGIAFLLDALDTRVRTAENVSEMLELPLLARIPDLGRRGRRAPVVMSRSGTRDGADGVAAEAFRTLRTNLEFSLLRETNPTVLITSALQGEGKSVTAANLGAALARAGRRVVLVDLDLRAARLHDLFEVPVSPGLTDIALGRSTLDEALQTVTVMHAGEDGKVVAPDGSDTLTLLTAGPQPPDPGDFLTTPAVSALLGALSDRFDIVIVDASPLLPIADAVALSAYTNAILTVVRMPGARRKVVQELHRVLQGCGGRKLGVVTTLDDEVPGVRGSGYGSPYGDRTDRPLPVREVDQPPA